MSKRVGIIGFGWLVEGQGDPYYPSNLIYLLKTKTNIEYKFIVPKNAFIMKEINDNKKIRFYREYRSGSFLSIIKTSLCIIDIIRIIKKEKIEFVHIPTTRPFWLFPLLLYLKIFTNCEIMIRMHEFYKKEGDLDIQNRFLMNKIEYYFESKLSDYIILGGKEMYYKYRKKFKTNAKIIIASLGTYSILSNYGSSIKRDKNQILFFGRIERYKGVDVLLKSLSYLKKEYKLTIAGKATLEFSKKIKKLANVRLIDKYIPQNELIKLFRKCALVALPYRDGTQSGVVSLAYAFNKPVIVTKVGSIHEIVKHNVTGYVIPPNDPKMLAKYINRILGNTELQENFEKKIEEYGYKINEKLIKTIIKPMRLSNQ